MAKQKLRQTDLWQTDEEFEELLQSSLAAIQPPADFSERVMRAVRLEAAESELARKEEAQKAGILRLPWRRWSVGVGSCAAAVLLFCAVAGPLSQEPAGMPFAVGGKLAQNAQVAAILEQPQRASGVPEQTEPVSQGVQREQAGQTEQRNQAPASQTAEPRSSAPAAVQSQGGEEPLPEGSGQLVLPRAAYGSTAQGTLSVRLLAKVEGNAIYAPNVSARGKSAAFYTADDQNIYTWQVDLAEASLPDVTAVTPLSEASDALVGTTAAVSATDLVGSPDGTMLAQNSREGLWISLTEGEVFLLTEEGAGSLLAWAPDSSKLLFTNADGALFVGYPLERRIYQVTDMPVKDVCWSEDNKTVVFQAEVEGEDCLYVAETV